MGGKEVAEYLSMSEKAIYHRVARGTIPHNRIGKLLRFRRSEIDRWLDSDGSDEKETT